MNVTERLNKMNRLKRQSGAALVVSLILLAVVTLLGISSMKGSNADLKMAASMRDRGIAFEAAEAGLAFVEERLALDPPERVDLLTGCEGNGCFNPTCEGGLCFSGEYHLTTPEYNCQTVNTGSGAGGGSGKGKKGGGGGSSELEEAPVQYWSDTTLDVWNTDSRHLSIQIDGVSEEIKYIVEFLCFVPRDELTPFSEKDGENNNGAPLFRITALAEGNGKRASVALQSTYKVLNGH